jgi:plastocyanin
MSSFKKNDQSPVRGPRMQTSRRLGPVAGLLIVLALLVAACSSAAEPAALPTAMPTSAPAPTDTSVAEGMPVPGDTPVPEMEVVVEPSVTVADQEIVDGNVTVAEVVSDGPGWLVIHAQADGKPGPILGHSPVSDGTSGDVMIEIDTANATETLYAMLHIDAGEVGTWEFPGGPDTPVTVGEQVVTPAFAVTGGLLPAGEAVTPSVTVADQGLVDGKVTIAEVVSNGPGWLVVHAQANGNPGPVLGYSPVADGANSNVTVQIDLTAATTALYAMLHTDAGTVGTWEFPGGADTPVTVNDQMVSPAFNLLAASGEAEVEIEDFQFNSKVLVIRAGTTVKFSNKDDVPHTATSDTGVWDSGYLAKGEDFFFTFTDPGVYPYYCIPHGGPGGQGMAATIIVLQ